MRSPLRGRRTCKSGADLILRTVACNSPAGPSTWQTAYNIPMTLQADVCIRGAGIVGRTLALLLARAGLRVALVVPPGAGTKRPDIRAYSISPASRALLQELRCWPDAPDTTPVLAMQVWGDDGGELNFSAAQEQVPALNWIADVPALETQLAQACSYQGSIQEVADALTAPLTVVCEGRASETRTAWGIEFRTHRYPQTALATRLNSEHAHGQIARQWFGSDGEVLAFLPLGGEQGHELAVVWSLPNPKIESTAALDDTQLADRMHAVSGGLLGRLEIQGGRAQWPLMVGQASRWTGTIPDQPGCSFALAGDAAHTMHPLAGLGLNTGLSDVRNLARVLGARERWRSLSDLRLLRRYERACQGEWLQTRLATDALQLLFAHPSDWAAGLRNRGMSAFDHLAPLKHWVAQLAMGEQSRSVLGFGRIRPTWRADGQMGDNGPL